MYLLNNIEKYCKAIIKSRSFTRCFSCWSHNVECFKSVQPVFRKNQLRTKTQMLPYEMDTNVVKDVLLFKYENDRFYRILNFFALSQFVFWVYLSEFAYSSLRDISLEEAEKQVRASLPPEAQNQKLVWWRRINLGENKYRNGITFLSLTLGVGIITAITTATRRTVKYVTLLSGGEMIKMTMYSPWWLPAKTITTSVNNFNCQSSRSGVSNLAIRVKGNRFHFILSKEGTFTNSKLFDLTAGLKRTWR